MGRAEVWHVGEELAAQYLTGLGWQVLERNWRCPAGELDIVAHRPRPGAGGGLLRGEVPHRTRLRAATGRRSPRPRWPSCARWPCTGCGPRPRPVAAHPVRRGGGAAVPRRATDHHPRAGDRPVSQARAWSVALVGVEGTMVEVEAAISSGLPKTIMVGLPDAALYEARDRCRAAMASAGFGWPSDPVTINLSPATLPKAGSHYDLAIAAAVAAAGRRFDPAALEGMALFGELGLDGRVRTVRGLLPALLAVARRGFGRVVVPAGQLREAALVEGLGDRRGRRPRRPVRHPARRPGCGRAAADRRRRTQPGRRSTWPTWSARWRASGPSRWRRPDATTCSCTVRRAWARPCWPNGCPGCCPTSSRRRRWRCRPCTPWPG